MNAILATIGFVIIVLVVLITVSLIKRNQRDAAWRQFASEIGAEFVDGGFFRSSKVQAQVMGRMITLDTYSVSSGDSNETYTRVRTSIQNMDGFQFTIFRTGLVAKLDKALGAQDIGIGDPDFDKAFTLRSNNESKAQTLFSNLKIRQLIQAQKFSNFGIKKNELSYVTKGIVRDVESLKSIFELVKETLNQLEA